ncbi:MAG: prevent-host-death protein [Candidatus Parabeggiatoa sp. nov. 2]|nr:MAG: prevent-host-death protein [Beggiatoa sp. 4572_84]RKZ56647.1 MAG: prevent-host-death protein [Gammaproteobacteria bacterium]
MSYPGIQRVLDEKGTITSVIVPIDIWREIQSEEKETAYLLKSEAMKQRLLAAKNRREGIDFEVACEKLGI